MENEIKKGEIVIYKDQIGPEIQVKLENETVWLNQAQMADLFQKDTRTINEHIQNIFKEAELSQNSVIRNFRVTARDGKTYNVNFYNLDVIISVGYRVKSKRGTQFRIWATQRLKDYLVKGFSLNDKRLKQLDDLTVKLKELQSAHKLIQGALENKRLEGYEKELLRIITDYADTWFLLNQYDKGRLDFSGLSKKSGPALNYESLISSIAKFKTRLAQKQQAGSLFGQEVANKFKAALGSINQTYGGKDLYPSLEEKAAHLLYFCIKDHPFADGNKRIGSLTFLLYLIDNHFLYDKHGERKVNDNTLTVLALLIAESKPSDKEVMVKLVANLIK